MARQVIDTEYEINNIVSWIRDYFISNGDKDTKAIIGISGGKDSTIAAALLVRALGPERVVGVLMPNGTQTDIDDSYKVCSGLGIKCYTINIGLTMDALTKALPNELFDSRNEAYYTNTPARLRMTTLYAIAAMEHGRVCHTGNASEAYIGYTTKYGDLAGDFSILRHYYVRDVLAIGLAMPEIPARLVTKTPGDGMCGKSDEDNFGFTYEELDAHCLDDATLPYDTLRAITEMYRRNHHKYIISLPAPNVLSRHEEGTEWTPQMSRWAF